MADLTAPRTLGPELGRVDVHPDLATLAVLVPRAGPKASRWWCWRSSLVLAIALAAAPMEPSPVLLLLQGLARRLIRGQRRGDVSFLVHHLLQI
eukprot:8809349-Pyramimonas_sp.AAC.1